MKLPVSPQSYDSSPDSLVRAVKRARMLISRTVAEESQLQGVTVFTNADRPGVRLGNCAFEASGDQDADASQSLAVMIEHFTGRRVRCQAIDSAATDWSEPWRAALEAVGYRAQPKYVYLLRNYQPRERESRGLQIVPGRAVYRDLRPFYELMARRAFDADDRLASDYADAMIDRLDESRLELFVGRLDGRCVGAAGVITLGNIGVIDPAYVDPDRRGGGVAAALMAHCLDHCARALFERVLVDRSEGCYSIPFYQSLGFVEAASFVRFNL